jgi:hypothetical protein
VIAGQAIIPTILESMTVLKGAPAAAFMGIEQQMV